MCYDGQAQLQRIEAKLDWLHWALEEIGGNKLEPQLYAIDMIGNVKLTTPRVWPGDLKE